MNQTKFLVKFIRFALLISTLGCAPRTTAEKAPMPGELLVYFSNALCQVESDKLLFAYGLRPDFQRDGGALVRVEAGRELFWRDLLRRYPEIERVEQRFDYPSLENNIEKNAASLHQHVFPLLLTKHLPLWGTTLLSEDLKNFFQREAEKLEASLTLEKQTSLSLEASLERIPGLISERPERLEKLELEVVFLPVEEGLELLLSARALYAPQDLDASGRTAFEAISMESAKPYTEALLEKLYAHLMRIRR